MKNVMTNGMESKLRLPSTYVEVGDNEMEYLDGGASSWQKAMAIICGIGLGVAFGGAGGLLLGIIVKTIAIKIVAGGLLAAGVSAIFGDFGGF